MPYASNDDLPASLQKVLPAHAQDIYRAAFNNAFGEYARRSNGEAIAHRVAWAAVKRQYRKIGDRWIAQPR
jgi:cation transport regulator